MDFAQIRPVILFAACFLNLIFAYLVWSKSKTREAFHLGWVALFSAVASFTWGGVFFFASNKLLWVRATWLSPFVAGANMIFVYYFTGKTKFLKFKVIFWYGFSMILAVIALTTPYIIYKVSDQYPYLSLDTAGLLNQLFRIIVLPYLVLPFYYLIGFYRKSIGAKKLQTKYLILGVLIYTSAALLFNGILPFLNYQKFFSYLDAPAYFSVIWLGLSTYAIISKKLFDIRVILTEMFVALIGLILLVQVFFAQGTQAKIISLAIFLLYLVIGYLLIKSTDQEIEKEEKAEKLAKELEELNLNLEKKVAEKTKELRGKVAELGESKKALINILEDNTEAREKIEEEKNKTLAIIANFTDPIIVLDENYKISMINPAAARVFGLSGADLGAPVKPDGKFSMANFKSVIKKDFQIKEIDKISNRRNSFISEEITIAVNDQEATYKVITAKVLGADNNETLGTMKIFYDLTREKEIDKLKSEFISVAAHQLRTPLSAIKWVIKMILDGDAGELNMEQQELLSKGYRSNERIIRLVNDLLNVSRIEEGKFGFNFEKADFQEVLNTAIGNLESLAAKNHQELRVRKPDQLPRIYLDKERMAMVVQNLLDNAIKYTPEYGKIDITVEVDKQSLHVKIKDQGVGIPQKDQAKLFSKFFRATNAVRLETEGTGLGLFIVKNIIDKHGGTVGLKSEEGKGTEVSFSIPINQAQIL